MLQEIQILFVFNLKHSIIINLQTMTPQKMSENHRPDYSPNVLIF